MRKELSYWLALQRVVGIGDVMAKRLIEHFGDPHAVFSASERELMEVEGIGPHVVSSLKCFDQWRDVAKEEELIEKNQVEIITMKDRRYPKNLLSIYNPPPFLYVRGEIQEGDDLAVAIVGSRMASEYGKMATEKISYALAEKGVTIVSGMARGIDSFAHRGAIEANGRTIAVLGCGIDILYPPENRDLCSEIVSHGAVISEFSISTPPLPVNFPKRNRVISGLSLGVVVVEASSRSGSLITARLGLEQGREVFSVPGRLDSTRSKGTHQLIKQGAKLVEEAEDILSEILPQWGLPQRLKEEKRKREEGLPVNSKGILDLLSLNPLHIDDLICQSKMKSGEVSSILLDLELKGWLRQLPGKMFVKVRE
jgi:DNA processing protein